ncbi:MAG: DUF1501 domain-containing protein [Lysobacteraceae bacterium]
MKRRDFLRRSLGTFAGLGAYGVAGTLGNLNLIGAAMAAEHLGKGIPDFKALVCIFQYGGNDAFNTLIPRDGGTHAEYAASRGPLALDLATAAALPLNPTQPPAGGGQYGLHPGMTRLQGLFNGGQCAVVSNVGPLLYPITKAQFQNASVPVPPQLFSHDDQQFQWQTAWPDSATGTGWAGRMADALIAANGNSQVSMCMSLAGSNTLQVGNVVQPYFVGAYGLQNVFFIEDEWNQTRRESFLAIQQLARQSDTHVFERAYGGIMNRALTNHDLIQAALAATPAPSTTFPDNFLGAQLAMVARMISIRSALGMQRQIYFVADTGGYDTHDNQLAQHGTLLPNLSECMGAFYDATVELGVANDVTSFTASDFGRTLSVNGDGTDHGWGSHHFVVGGGVNGGRFYGTMPSLVNEGPDDAGWGQIIPTTAVDQYASTLAHWFGVSPSNIADVLPNIGRFSGSDLGFMA